MQAFLGTAERTLSTRSRAACPHLVSTACWDISLFCANSVMSNAANEENFNPTERKADGGFIEYLRVGGRTHADQCHSLESAMPCSNVGRCIVVLV